jgi:outer membrane immunogenic protein
VDSTHPGGAIGGIQLGYNWKSLPNWIFGIEADIQASGQNASSAPLSQSFFTSFIFFELSASDLNSHNDALNWFGTVRGRVGYAIWPTTMLYATGGFAYGRISTSVTNTTTATLCEFQFCFGPFSSTATLNGAAVEPGWTAGGGIEGAVPNTRVTWKVEYLYIALNTANFSITTPFPVVTSVRFTDNIVRIGLNWHLN